MQPGPFWLVKHVLNLHHDDGDWIPWKGTTLSEIGVKHFIGKGGRHLRRLGTLTTYFIELVDSKNVATDVHIYGPCYSINIVR